MSPKPEYWIISEKQFEDFKSRIENLGQRVFESLDPYGFTKIEAQPEWLGFTVSRQKEGLLTLVSMSLYSETPLEFELIVRQWNTNNPTKTFKDFYRSSFSDLHKLESNLYLELENLRVILKNGL